MVYERVTQMDELLSPLVAVYSYSIHVVMASSRFDVIFLIKAWARLANMLAKDASNSSDVLLSACPA